MGSLLLGLTVCLFIGVSVVHAGLVVNPTSYLAVNSTSNRVYAISGPGSIDGEFVGARIFVILEGAPAKGGNCNGDCQN